jgi:hypothetical protein
MDITRVILVTAALWHVLKLAKARQSRVANLATVDTEKKGVGKIRRGVVAATAVRG